jgi:hypothetical protein
MLEHAFSVEQFGRAQDNSIYVKEKIEPTTIVWHEPSL